MKSSRAWNPSESLVNNASDQTPISKTPQVVSEKKQVEIINAYVKKKFFFFDGSYDYHSELKQIF